MVLIFKAGPCTQACIKLCIARGAPYFPRDRCPARSAKKNVRIASSDFAEDGEEERVGEICDSGSFCCGCGRAHPVWINLNMLRPSFRYGNGRPGPFPSQGDEVSAGAGIVSAGRAEPGNLAWLGGIRMPGVGT